MKPRTRHPARSEHWRRAVSFHEHPPACLSFFRHDPLRYRSWRRRSPPRDNELRPPRHNPTESGRLPSPHAYPRRDCRNSMAILTPIWEPMLGSGAERDSRMAALVKDTPPHRFGMPEKEAALATFLASDEAP